MQSGCTASCGAQVDDRRVVGYLHRLDDVARYVEQLTRQL